MTTTLDNALSKQQIKDVDFIKMDVEGSEVDIIVWGETYTSVCFLCRGGGLV